MILTAGEAAIMGYFTGEATVVEAGFELRALHYTTQPAQTTQGQHCPLIIIKRYTLIIRRTVLT